MTKLTRGTNEYYKYTLQKFSLRNDKSCDPESFNLIIFHLNVKIILYF